MYRAIGVTGCITAIVMAVNPATGVSDLYAQAPASNSAWQKQAESRLKAIYDRGEFRPRRFQAKWLADSSGYTVQERNPKTNKPGAVVYDVLTGKRRAVPKKSKSDTDKPSKRGSLRSPDGKRVIEFRDRNLFVRDLESGQRTQLTKRDEKQDPKRDTKRDVRYRDPVWSPNGKHVAFVETDSTDVRQRAVLVPGDPSYPSVQYPRFARVGGAIPKLRVGVVDSAGNSVQWLPIETPDDGFYLGQVEWAGNSDEVLVETLSRFRDEHDFHLVNIGARVEARIEAQADATVKRIYHESNDAWAVGSQEKNLGLTWVDDGNAFVVISEKDGWRHAFLHSRDGKEMSVLTPGEYDVIDRAAIDEDGGWYYFYASPDNGTQKHLYRVALDGSGKSQRMTPEDQTGTHDYEFSPDFKFAFHTVSTLDSPPLVELVKLPDHEVVRVLEDNAKLRKRMQDVVSHPTEFLQLDIGNDISMDAWLIKPKDFDETKKYPVFIYVYGEPYAQTVLDKWGAAQVDFHRVVADLGYLVVSIDNRGTPAPKGAAWRRSIFGSLGPLSTEEQEAGLKELARMKPYVDLSRVGIWGWSGGGSNTLNAMFRKPDSYHVGIAVVPKPQPHLYNAWFQEIYMRTRKVNADGYQTAAAMNYADGLKGKLLIMTGSGETNTHIQIIEGLVDRLIELGKAFDYMVYPNRDHGLAEGRGTVVHVRMRIIRYLIEHLSPGAG